MLIAKPWGIGSDLQDRAWRIASANLFETDLGRRVLLAG